MKLVIGPELFWVILYLSAILLGYANQIPNKSLNAFIESLWFWIPIVSLAVFLLWKVDIVEKNWLMTRIWVSGIIGGHFVIEKALSAYSDQGPGIGMGYLAGMMLLLILLTLGSILIKLFF